MRENGVRLNIFSATQGGRIGRGASSAFMVLLFCERETERGNFFDRRKQLRNWETHFFCPYSTCFWENAKCNHLILKYLNSRKQFCSFLFFQISFSDLSQETLNFLFNSKSLSPRLDIRKRKTRRKRRKGKRKKRTGSKKKKWTNFSVLFSLCLWSHRPSFLPPSPLRM